MKLLIVGNVEIERGWVQPYAEEGDPDEEGVLGVTVGGQRMNAYSLPSMVLRTPVTVAIMRLPGREVVSRQEGPEVRLWDADMGYSEYSPGEYAKMSVGQHDLLPVFEGLEGKQVAVWIADEPVNVLDFSEADVRLGEPA